MTKEVIFAFIHLTNISPLSGTVQGAGVTVMKSRKPLPSASFCFHVHIMQICVCVSVRESERGAIYIHIKKTHMQIDTRHPCTQYQDSDEC